MTQDKFFGRDNYLTILEKRIRGLKDGFRQNIAIIGDEFVGKTTIIYRFLSKFYDPLIIPVYLEVRPETFSAFRNRFCATLLYNFLLNSNFALNEDLDYLIKKASGFAPKTCEKIKEITSLKEKKNNSRAFAELLSLTDSIRSETGKSCVVIFDEFQNLEKTGIKNLYSEWAKVLILQKNTLYIVISSQRYRTKNILSKELSLLFGNFEIINIEPFDLKTSENFLESRFKDKNISVNPGVKNFMVNFTGGYPFYLGLVTEGYLKSENADLTLILEDLLFEPTGALHQRFSNYLKRFLDSNFSQDYISIMRSVAQGTSKIKDIAHLLHKTKSEIVLRVDHLLELDCLDRSGDFLFFNDRVFGFWLKFVYQTKINSLTFNAKNQREQFVTDVKFMINEFMQQTKKTVTERLQELLGLFSDETIQLETKRLKLTHFREIKPLEFTQSKLKEGLIGRSQDSLWLIAFKREALTEEDISDFSKECKKYRQKPQKKIILTAREIDDNARLRGLEEQILTWDLNHLNKIVDLFSKPRIIA